MRHSAVGYVSAGEEIRYYSSFDEDIIVSKDQDAQIPRHYKWFHTNLIYRAAANIVYGLATIFAFIYAKFVFHIKVVNRQAFRKCRKQGYILYGNHTQPVGDAFNPATYVAPKRIYTVAGPANLGIPVLGKILPMLGALITPDSYEGTRQFMDAIGKHLKKGRCIVVYPEAHVWPWCTFIRPFSETAFKFPPAFDVPCYCMTTTYHKPRHGKRPRIVVYIDGPFYADGKNKVKAEQKKLHDEIFDCMSRRSQNSDYEYIRYEKVGQ